MKNKKTGIAIISLVALLLVLIGVTYAYWLVTKTQTNSNIISSACLDITLDNEANDINLSSQYPMSDEDGMKLTPYTFTVTNNCNTTIYYRVALEAIGDDKTAIASDALKVSLDADSQLYSSYTEASTTIGGAYESRVIKYAKLAASGVEGSSKTHNLRIWIDENAPISEANKTFQSKISITTGQGISIPPFSKGTLAYDILSNYGEKNLIPEIDENELADRIVSNGNVYVGTTGNYYYGTTYTYDTATSKYVLEGEIVQAKLSECRDGTKTCGKYATKSTVTSGATLYEITDFKTTGDYVTAYTKKYTTSFAGKAEESGLYKAIDDLGDSYYFRGDVTNNYVQFGKYVQMEEKEIGLYSFCYGEEIDGAIEEHCLYDEEALLPEESCEAKRAEFEADNYAYVDSECDLWDYGVVIEATPTENPLYWRIVRINGDGTIRLIYDGLTKVENGTQHSASVAQTPYLDSTPDKVGKGGYTYNLEDGTKKDSDIKKFIDQWYSHQIEDRYAEYIADGIFCNDREIAGYRDAIGIDGQEAYYASYERLYLNKKPKLACTRLEDRYTIGNNLGNGLLTYPVGLLTADEAVFAGTAFGYLYSGENFYTITPVDPYEYNADVARTWTVSKNGGMGLDGANQEYSARPVINLRADVEFTGDGSFEIPYVIKTN